MSLFSKAITSRGSFQFSCFNTGLFHIKRMNIFPSKVMDDLKLCLPALIIIRFCIYIDLHIFILKSIWMKKSCTKKYHVMSDRFIHLIWFNVKAFLASLLAYFLFIVLHIYVHKFNLILLQVPYCWFTGVGSQLSRCSFTFLDGSNANVTKWHNESGSPRESGSRVFLIMSVYWTVPLKTECISTCYTHLISGNYWITGGK